MAEMGDVDFLIPDRVENKIAKAWNNNYAHVRFVDFTTLIGRMGQLHCPIDEPRHNAGRRGQTLLSDVCVDMFKVLEPGRVKRTFIRYGGDKTRPILRH
jgi:hypothetical protein